MQVRDYDDYIGIADRQNGFVIGILEIGIMNDDYDNKG